MRKGADSAQVMGLHCVSYTKGWTAISVHIQGIAIYHCFFLTKKSCRGRLDLGNPRIPEGGHGHNWKKMTESCDYLG
jgi:hypothetical protein